MLERLLDPVCDGSERGARVIQPGEAGAVVLIGFAIALLIRHVRAGAVQSRPFHHLCGQEHGAPARTIFILTTAIAVEGEALVIGGACFLTHGGWNDPSLYRQFTQHAKATEAFLVVADDAKVSR